MRKSRMALAVASALPLSLCWAVQACVQTADGNPPVEHLAVDLYGMSANPTATPCARWRLTWTDSKITRNDKFPASMGRWPPCISQWRARALATYGPDDTWSCTRGARYSGKQLSTLDNTDPHGLAYQGASPPPRHRHARALPDPPTARHRRGH